MKQIGHIPCSTTGADEILFKEDCFINLMANYYEILEITKTADQREIKKAYRRMSKLYHPDVNHTPGSAEVFKTILKAYSTLSNPKKRYSYDVQLRAGSFEEKIRGNRHYEAPVYYEEKPKSKRAKFMEKFFIGLLISIPFLTVVAVVNLSKLPTETVKVNFALEDLEEIQDSGQAILNFKDAILLTLNNSSQSTVVSMENIINRETWEPKLTNSLYEAISLLQEHPEIKLKILSNFEALGEASQKSRFELLQYFFLRANLKKEQFSLEIFPFNDDSELEERVKHLEAHDLMLEFYKDQA